MRTRTGLIVAAIALTIAGCGDKSRGVDFPPGPDGDVFRLLVADGFDFSKQRRIDFDVDFDQWPPSTNALATLAAKYDYVEVLNPTEEDMSQGITNGYVLIQIEDLLSYDLVIKTQSELTELMQPFGGRCESWGVVVD